MAELTLYEIKQSQLADMSIVDGALIVCTDTQNLYHDTASERIHLGSFISTVSSLPLAPIANKPYLIGKNLYVYNGTEWLWLNDFNLIITKNSVSEFPSVGNEAFLYISKDENSSYRWDDTNIRYYCIGSDWSNIQVINGGTSV